MCFMFASLNSVDSNPLHQNSCQSTNDKAVAKIQPKKKFRIDFFKLSTQTIVNIFKSLADDDLLSVEKVKDLKPTISKTLLHVRNIRMLCTLKNFTIPPPGINFNEEQRHWILNLLTIHELGIKIPTFESAIGKTKELRTYHVWLIILQKSAIQKELEQVTTLDLGSRNLRELPKSLKLLVNIKYINLYDNSLQTVSLRFFEHLESLDLRSNAFINGSNIDVTRNQKLRLLLLSHNYSLETFPDLSKNRTLSCITFHGTNIRFTFDAICYLQRFTSWRW